jgi:hypothetical protein
MVQCIKIHIIKQDAFVIKFELLILDNNIVYKMKNFEKPPHVTNSFQLYFELFFKTVKHIDLMK